MKFYRGLSYKVKSQIEVLKRVNYPYAYFPIDVVSINVEEVELVDPIWHIELEDLKPETWECHMCKCDLNDTDDTFDHKVPLCNDCHEEVGDDEFQTCWSCSDYELESEGDYKQDQFLCHSCYDDVDVCGCGGLVAIDNATILEDGRVFCDYCAEDLWHCDECGTWHTSDENEYEEHCSSTTICEYCLNRNEDLVLCKCGYYIDKSDYDRCAYCEREVE